LIHGNLIIAGIGFPPRQDLSVESRRRFYREGIDRLVCAAGCAFGCDRERSRTVRRDGKRAPDSWTRNRSLRTARASHSVVNNSSPPWVWRVMKGRVLSAADVEGAHHVVVINETLAKEVLQRN
jgi:hypothetical protein